MLVILVVRADNLTFCDEDKEKGRSSSYSCTCHDGKWGNGDTEPLIRNLVTKWSGQLDATATITPEKDPRVTHWMVDWVSHQSPSGRFGKEQCLLNCLHFYVDLTYSFRNLPLFNAGLCWLYVVIPVACYSYRKQGSSWFRICDIRFLVGFQMAIKGEKTNWKLEVYAVRNIDVMSVKWNSFCV
jgi:hypothetical protein